MWNRHTWAAWDTRAILYFTVNNILMGSEEALPAGTKLVGRVRLSAEDALQVIEIVSGGNVVWRTSSASPDVDETISLGQLEETCHFYVRLVQRDGGIAIGSPVFLTALK